MLYAIPRWQNVENYLTNFTRFDNVTSESRQHVFSMENDCLWLAQSIPTVFHLSGSKSEVVFRDGSRCGGRIDAVECDCPRAAQSILADKHTVDWSGTTLLVCSRRARNAWN